MAKPGYPAQRGSALSCRQDSRFSHSTNTDEVFGTHKPAAIEAPVDARKLAEKDIWTCPFHPQTLRRPNAMLTSGADPHPHMAGWRSALYPAGLSFFRIETPG